MTVYSNKGGESGVSKYEIKENSTGVQYLYTYESAGVENIEAMKELAILGEGLNSFINKYVRRDFQLKVR